MISESQFQQQVIDLALTYLLRIFHWPDSRRATDRGWPDLSLVGDRGLILAELKTAKGKLSDEQLEVGAMLRQISDACAVVEYHVWRPDDWPLAKEAMERIR